MPHYINRITENNTSLPKVITISGDCSETLTAEEALPSIALKQLTSALSPLSAAPEIQFDGKAFYEEDGMWWLDSLDAKVSEFVTCHCCEKITYIGEARQAVCCGKSIKDNENALLDDVLKLYR